MNDKAGMSTSFRHYSQVVMNSKKDLVLCQKGVLRRLTRARIRLLPPPAGGWGEQVGFTKIRYPFTPTQSWFYGIISIVCLQKHQPVQETKNKRNTGTGRWYLGYKTEFLSKHSSSKEYVVLFICPQ